MDFIVGEHNSVAKEMLNIFKHEIASKESTDKQKILILESESGTGKTSIVRKFYELLKIEIEDEYWPKTWNTANTNNSDPMFRRKIVAPPPNDFIWKAGTLPEYFWIGIGCNKLSDGNHMFILDSFRDQLITHSVPLTLANCKKSGLYEKTKTITFDFIESIRKEITDKGLEYALEKIFTGLSITLPYGETIVRWTTASTKKYIKHLDNKNKLKTDNNLKHTFISHKSTASKEITNLITKVAGKLPIIMVIEDIHWMNDDLLDLIKNILITNASVFVVATAWPEGKTTKNSYFSFLHDEEITKKLYLKHTPQLTINDLKAIVRNHAPKTDDATAVAISQHYQNPLYLNLALSLKSVQEIINEHNGALAINDLKLLPRDNIKEIVHARWNELDASTKLSLILAALWANFPDATTKFELPELNILFQPKYVSQLYQIINSDLKWDTVERDIEKSLIEDAVKTNWCRHFRDGESFLDPYLVDEVLSQIRAQYSPKKISQIENICQILTHRILSSVLEDPQTNNKFIFSTQELHQLLKIQGGKEKGNLDLFSFRSKVYALLAINLKKFSLRTEEEQNLFIFYSLMSRLFDNYSKLNRDANDYQDFIDIKSQLDQIIIPEKFKQEYTMATTRQVGWGPERPTYTMEVRPDYPCFNSVTNQRPYGDERNFCRIKLSNQPNNTYTDIMGAFGGETFTVYVHYQNCAVNTDESGKDLSSTNTILKIYSKSRVKPFEFTPIVATIKSDNTNPPSVWDGVSLMFDREVALRYVDGSAKIHSAGAVDNLKLDPNELFYDGAKLGYYELDGTLPAGPEYSGYVTFELKADYPDFVLRQSARYKDTKKWLPKLTVQPGCTFSILAEYKNVGTIDQDDVLLKFTIPPEFEYIPGTLRYKNSSHLDSPQINNPDLSKYLNVGSYAPGANVFLFCDIRVRDIQISDPLSLQIRSDCITANGNKANVCDITIIPTNNNNNITSK